MLTVYRLVTLCYFLALRLAALFSGKARKWVSGRRGWRRELEQLELHGKIVWIHCASMGEYEQARPLIESLVQADHSVRIVLTFFSPTGYENGLNDSLAHAILYLPQDGPRNARDFVAALRPDLVIFIKYEFWYYTLEAVFRAHIPLILVSAHFRPDQFTGLRKFYFKQLIHLYDHIFVQDESSRQLLEDQLAYQHASVVGDTRYDRVWKLAHQPASLPSAIEALDLVRPLIVCGSTWPADEHFLAQVRQLLESAIPNLRPSWVIVPHEPGFKALNRLYKLFGSDLRVLDPGITQNDYERGAVYVINQVGWLSRLYSLADACWVGGGFGTGIHNVLEAAVYGKGVCFGPNYTRFFEAVELTQVGLAWPCKEIQEASHRLSQLLVSFDLRQEIALRAVDFVRQRCGATQEIVRWLEMQFIIENDFKT